MIKAQLDRAMSGQATLCQVTGSAGSGKSTLLRAFVASLDPVDQPAVIAWGHCDQQTGTIRPLGPWTEILQSFSAWPTSWFPKNNYAIPTGFSSPSDRPSRNWHRILSSY